MTTSQSVLYLLAALGGMAAAGETSQLVRFTLAHAAIGLAVNRATGRREAAWSALIALHLGLGYLLELMGFSDDTVLVAYQAMAAADVLIAAGLRPTLEDSPTSPFLTMGLAVSLLAVLGQLAGIGNWTDYSVITGLAGAAAVYGLAYRTAAVPHAPRVTEALGAIAYVLLMLRWEVDQAIIYSALPALMLAIRGRYRAAMPVLFVPPLVQAVGPREGLAIALTAGAALATLALGVKARLRSVFLGSLAVLALVFAIQLVHLIDFGRVPMWMWVGAASAILVFAGFWGERNFKREVQSFFTDWK